MRLTLNRLPAKCLNWLISSRIEFLDSMKGGHPTRFFAAHLPVMATWSEDRSFPVNMTVKGLGLLPEHEHVQYFTDVFESVIAESRALPWEESMQRRIDAIKELYSDEGNFNPAVLGGLEIFGGKALENLRKNSYASLLYVGMTHTPEGIQYISFQVNSEVMILEKDDPLYRFLLAARKLFEFDKFHLYQPDYPFGYLFRIVEVLDKSPWSKKHGTE